MADRVHPREDSLSSFTLTASSENSGEVPAVAVADHRKPAAPPAPMKPLSPPPGTYVVQVPKDQIYRYPPPENSHRFESLSRRKPRRSCCFRCICFTLFIVLFVFFAAVIAAGILYLIFRPQSPNYSVSEVSIKGFDLTLTSPLTPEFDVLVRAENPNKKLGIYYGRGSSVDVLYGDFNLCNGGLPAFYQPTNNVTEVQTVLTGSEIVLSSGVKSSMASEQRQGSVPFRLNFKVPVKIKVGAVKTWKISVKVKCDIAVDALNENSRVIYNSCDYSVRPW